MTLKSNTLISQDDALSMLGKSRTDFRVGFISLYNAAAGATAATVALSSNVLTLVVTGGASAGTSTLTLTDAANDTLGELKTVIEALAKGWVVTRLSGSSQASTDLFSFGSTSCLLATNEFILYGFDGLLVDSLINAASGFIESFCRRKFTNSGALITETVYLNGNGEAYLPLPNYPVSNDSTIVVYSWDKVSQVVDDTFVEHTDYEVDFDSGLVYMQSGWLLGEKNYKVTYKYGYTTATMPEDLKNACLALVLYLYNGRDKAGMQSETIGSYSYTKQNTGQYMFMGLPIPPEVILMLSVYRRADLGF
jgi:hypothetical protein